MKYILRFVEILSSLPAYLDFLWRQLALNPKSIPDKPGTIRQR
jgi:hypothetical protein